jgi:hypothetical protein
MKALLTVLALALFLTPTARAGDDKKPASPRVMKAMEAVQKYLAKLGGEGEPMLLSQEAAPVAATFPEHVFIIARYRIYPVARILPKGLNPSNVFAVSKDDRVERVADTGALQKFFAAHAKDFLIEQKVKDGLATWLTLTQEFHQDGFFKFEVLEKDMSIEKKGEDFTARGRALVVGGGNGEIAATALFERGQLAKVDEKVKIIEGPRPICQATKLLDADPIVRQMAERDLLFMGLAARDYILEQRGKAGPELRVAIDRLWERIVRNGW